MSSATYDPLTSPAITSIVRVAVIVVTAVLFVASLANVMFGNRDVGVLLALATPLGLSALGFVRAGQIEASLGLLCCVLITVVTLVLALSRLGMHDMAVTAYGGIVLFASLLFSRRAFIAIAGLAIFAATAVFLYDTYGYSRSLINSLSSWPQLFEFLMIVSVFAVLGRMVTERLYGSLGQAHAAASADAVTGLNNRAGFMDLAGVRMKAAIARGESGALVLADLDAFRRINLVVGHLAADNILRETARRLSQLHDGDIVARVGDDEFAILRAGVSDEEAAAFASQVHAALDFEHMGVSVRNAAGFARFPRDASGIESLMMAAGNGVAVAKSHDRKDRLSGPEDRI